MKLLDIFNLQSLLKNTRVTIYKYLEIIREISKMIDACSAHFFIVWLWERYLPFYTFICWNKTYLIKLYPWLNQGLCVINYGDIIFL